MNINSPIKNSRLPIMSPNIRKNQKNNNMFNSINNNINNYKQKFGGEIQRTKKKRNTIAFTGQIFNEQMREKFKDKIKESEKEKEKERRESPKFLGLLSPLLKNIVNFTFYFTKDIDVTSNNPLSVMRSSGITGRAMNERVMNGSMSFETPMSYAFLIISSRAGMKRSVGSVLISPPRRSGRLPITSPSHTIV